MLGAIFRFIGKSGPSTAIAGAIFLLALALVLGIALPLILPIVFILLMIGVGLSVLWAIVRITIAVSRR